MNLFRNRRSLPFLVYTGTAIGFILFTLLVGDLPHDFLYVGIYGTGAVWLVWGLACIYDAWLRCGWVRWNIQWEYRLGVSLTLVGLGFLLLALQIPQPLETLPDWYIMFTWVRTVASIVAFYAWICKRFETPSGGPMDH